MAVAAALTPGSPRRVNEYRLSDWLAGWLLLLLYMPQARLFICTALDAI